MPYIVYCDSSMRIKGHVYAVGIHIINTINAEAHDVSRLIPCNDFSRGNIFIAEITAIMVALQELISMKVVNDSIELFSDNQAAVRMLNKLQVANTESCKIKRIRVQAKRLLKEFSNIQILWIPRKENCVAHNLCNEALSKKKVRKRKKAKKPPIEERAKAIKLLPNGNNTYVALSSNGKDSYIVDLSEHTCTCRYFAYLIDKQHEKCKHIMAAELYTEVD